MRYRLALGDGCYGPGDVEPLTVTISGRVAGPQLPNWDSEHLLARCEEEVSWCGDRVQWLVLSARYVGDTLAKLEDTGGIVAVGRILPGCDIEAHGQFGKDQVEYWAVGVLSRVDA